MGGHLLLVRGAGRPAPDSHPADAAAAGALAAQRRAVSRDARDDDVGGSGVARCDRPRTCTRVLHCGVARVAGGSPILAAAARDPVVARARPLPHPPTLPAPCVAPVFPSPPLPSLPPL